MNNIDESLVRRWRKSEAKILEIHQQPKRIRSTSIGERFGYRSRVTGGGRKPKFDEIEKQVVDWVDDRNAKGFPVTREHIKKYALEIFKFNEYEGEFSASAGWITNVMRRNDLRQRKKTHQVKFSFTKLTS